MLRRFNSSEVPEAAVHARVGALESVGVTDDEGYFALPLTLEPDAVGDGWHSAQVQVVSVPVRGFRPVSAAVDMLVPPATAELDGRNTEDPTGVVRTSPAQRLVDPCSAIWIHRLVAELNPMTSEPGSDIPGSLLCRDHYQARLSCAPGAHQS